MTEAERSVTERKVAVTKPMNHASSDEVYSPKRKRSDEFIRQVSPPPYIPSKKDSIGHRSGDDSSLRRGELPRLTRNDARHILSRGGDHKVIQRSRHDEIEQSVSSDQGTSLRSKRSGSSERGRGTKENDVREMKSDKGSQVYLGSSASRQTDSRKRKYSLSPDPKHISRTSLNQDSKSSIKARLGKIIIERKDSLENHKESMEGGRDTLVTTTQRDARESIIAKTRHSESKGYARKTNSGRVISNLGREAVQKQCQAAVISVQASQTSGKIKRDLSPDSRVVQCSIQSSDEETKDEENNKRIDDAATKPPYDVQSVIVRERSPRSDYDDENEDLAKMIDEDLGPELLQDAHDDFSLDLDIDDDLDLAVEVDQNQTSATDILQPEKDEKRANTRFIVTLDGVDEKQFFTEENKYEQFMQYPPRSEPTLAAPITASNSKHPQQSLFLDLHGGQSRPVLQIKAQQVQSVMSPSVVPSKLTPPKIQPFSISLKDSDDEHDDKEGKTSTARQNYYPSVEGIAVEDSETSALKRAKMLERCKFWPACAAGASCEYHHPTTHCKTFPNCKFGDKCFFIHPNCRFDSRCIRPDCPYTHTSRRPALTSSAQVITIPQSHLVFSAMPPRPQLVGHVSMQTVCRYFPNCQNMKCPYVHPKPCRFGIACRSPACLFSHPPVPGKDKLKWQAGSEQLKPAASSLLQSTVKLEPATAKPPSPDKTSLSPAVSSTSQ